jgi:hypothetical protein
MNKHEILNKISGWHDKVAALQTKKGKLLSEMVQVDLELIWLMVEYDRLVAQLMKVVEE